MSEQPYFGKDKEGNKILVLPTTINIMAPRRIGKRPRGRNANPETIQNRIFTVKLQEGYLAAYEEAAKLVGLSVAEFVRWVAYAAANEIIRLEKHADATAPNTVTAPKPQARPLITGVALPVDFDPYKSK
jgi:hypothetical protein